MEQVAVWQVYDLEPLSKQMVAKEPNIQRRIHLVRSHPDCHYSWVCLSAADCARIERTLSCGEAQCADIGYRGKKKCAAVLRPEPELQYVGKVGRNVSSALRRVVRFQSPVKTRRTVEVPWKLDEIWRNAKEGKCKEPFEVVISEEDSSGECHFQLGDMVSFEVWATACGQWQTAALRLEYEYRWRSDYRTVAVELAGPKTAQRLLTSVWQMRALSAASVLHLKDESRRSGLRATDRKWFKFMRKEWRHLPLDVCRSFEEMYQRFLSQKEAAEHSTTAGEGEHTRHKSKLEAQSEWTAAVPLAVWNYDCGDSRNLGPFRRFVDFTEMSSYTSLHTSKVDRCPLMFNRLRRLTRFQAPVVDIDAHADDGLGVAWLKRPAAFAPQNVKHLNLIPLPLSGLSSAERELIRRDSLVNFSVAFDSQRLRDERYIAVNCAIFNLTREQKLKKTMQTIRELLSGFQEYRVEVPETNAQLVRNTLETVTRLRQQCYDLVASYG